MMGGWDANGIYHPLAGEDGWADEMDDNLTKLGETYGRRQTAAVWAAGNPVLGAFVKGWETDTGLSKVGDGTTAWNDLGYVIGSSSAVGAMEWEKWSTFQTLQSTPAGFPNTIITGWETTATVGDDSLISAGFNPTTGVFVAPFSGWYFVNWVVQFAANATGYRFAGVGNVHSYQQTLASPEGLTILSGAGMTFKGAPGRPRAYDLTVNAEQGSGGPLDVVYASLHIFLLGGPMLGTTAP